MNAGNHVGDKVPSDAERFNNLYNVAAGAVSDLGYFDVYSVLHDIDGVCLSWSSRIAGTA